MTAPLPMPESPERVVRFWREAGFDCWFTSDAGFDRVFREHFMGAHLAAASRKLDAWMASAEGCLALLILLDQFPRNAFRGCAHMYATDPLARFIARHVLERGFDRQLDDNMRAFAYLPFEHSEDLGDQELSVKLFDALGGAFQPYAATHRDIIVRFGRFPHRNGELGRETTPAEQAFLENGGFAG
ncbi:uncharacterized protein (DUF924 family) [Luteibacter sp. OK325]|uniref:DUF924 family protein n=1 Tax=Luteibacter sp. OK325 TaxID=2135670 RepID=UPI000D353C92|nr:DUF924 family protein [Luteibacter sp. OK325]PTR27290.1 uncharacterized protein (DUF924 family) [Luteibacter sp. OK325]